MEIIKIIPKLNITALKLLYLLNFISNLETNTEDLYFEEVPIKYPEMITIAVKTTKMIVDIFFYFTK